MMSSKKWKENIDIYINNNNAGDINRKSDSAMQDELHNIASDARSIDYFIKHLPSNTLAILLKSLFEAIIQVNNLKNHTSKVTVSQEQKKKNISKLYQFGEKVKPADLQGVIRRTGFDPRKSISRLTRAYWRVVNWFKARNMYHTDQVVHEKPKPTKPIFRLPSNYNNSGGLKPDENVDDASSITSTSSPIPGRRVESALSEPLSPISQRKSPSLFSQTFSSTDSSLLSSLDGSSLLSSLEGSSVVSSITTDYGQVLPDSLFEGDTDALETTEQKSNNTTQLGNVVVSWDTVFAMTTPARCRNNQSTNSSEISSLGDGTRSSSLSSIN